MQALKKVASLVLALSLAVGGFGQTQPTPQEERAAKFKRQLTAAFEKGSRVKIETLDGRRLQGSVSEIREQDFVLTDEGRANTLLFAEINKLKRQSWANKRVLIGIAVTGGIIGLAFYAASQTR